MFEQLVETPGVHRRVVPLGADRVAVLEDTPPGPALIAQLESVTLAELTDGDKARVAAAWQRVAAWVAGQQLEAVGALSGPDARDWGQELVSAELRLAPGAADRLVSLARGLGGPAMLPVRADLRAGRITVEHARVVVDAVRRLPVDAEDAGDRRRDVVARLLAVARTSTVGRTRSAAAEVVAKVDPKGSKERHLLARAERRVVVEPADDGMAWLHVFGPAPAVQTIYAGLDAHARRLRSSDSHGIDGRTLPQLRFDVLHSAGDHLLADPDLPKVQGRPPGIYATVSLATLLGLRDDPGLLEGYGPIPAVLARELAADGEWRLAVTDELTGRLLHLGRRSYRPNAALREHVLTRDGACRFPCCGRPARRVDLDHRRPFPEGPTCPKEMQPLCERHHIVKHEAGWEVEQLPDGTLRWTSPDGRVFTEPPHRFDPGVDPPKDPWIARLRRRAAGFPPPPDLEGTCDDCSDPAPSDPSLRRAGDTESGHPPDFPGPDDPPQF